MVERLFVEQDTVVRFHEQGPFKVVDSNVSYVYYVRTLGVRLMVGRRILVPSTGVRVPDSQPTLKCLSRRLDFHGRDTIRLESGSIPVRGLVCPFPSNRRRKHFNS